MAKYGKVVNYDRRVRHPVVRKTRLDKNGRATIIPLTTSATQKRHKHVDLGKIKIGSSKREGNKKGKTYAVKRVIHEDLSNLGPNFHARINHSQNKKLNKIFNRFNRKEKKKKG